MSLYNSPLLLGGQTLGSLPCQKWLALTKSAEEFFELARVLSGIPTSWIAWAEKRYSRTTNRRQAVASPLAYRMSILWNGIVLQQETKFLCDLLENALRLGILKHSQKFNVSVADIMHTLPAKRWKSLIDGVGKGTTMEVVADGAVPEVLLLNFTFYETCETISRNWSKVRRHSGGLATGFGNLFWKDKSCRDRSSFDRDMKIVREARNKIAHSKALFEKHETQKVYRIASRWLGPLDRAALTEGIGGYRRMRPGFLQGF